VSFFEKVLGKYLEKPSGNMNQQF